MSHETIYVGGLLSASLGSAKTTVATDDGEELVTDDDAKARNHIYMRSQFVGAKRLKLSKTANDTVTCFTSFLSGAPATGYDPSPYRTGYNKHGPLPEAQ